MKYKCPFVINQLVKFKCPKDCLSPSNYPFKNNEILLFLGEIKQMKGHCIIVNGAGKVFWGYHTNNFVEPNDDEI